MNRFPSHHWLGVVVVAVVVVVVVVVVLVVVVVVADLFSKFRSQTLTDNILCAKCASGETRYAS